MTSFDFNIVKRKIKSKAKNITKDINFKGVIYFKDTKCVVHLENDNKYYDIAEKSYSTKNVRIVYRLNNGNIIKYIRDIDSTMFDYNPLWIPFSIGNCVLGNIINNEFVINKIYIDHKDDDANKALHQYKMLYKKE